ncbi:hypothetical protein TNCV_3794611 [Trichonephila clavipes]|nr:hypothetical protein TNCV_3794611 [Trichonephila clavipes]
MAQEPKLAKLRPGTVEATQQDTDRKFYGSQGTPCFDHGAIDRVVVYGASTPQVWGSINGLRKVDSAFHPRYIGSINEYQACLGS